MEKENFIYVVFYKPKVIFLHTKIGDLPIKIQEMLHEFSDIMIDGLPSEIVPKRSIIHHIDLIPG